MNCRIWICLLLGTLLARAEPPDRYFHERTWSELEGQRAEGAGNAATFRKWMQATIIPEFAIDGPLDRGIPQLMNVSRKHSPDGRAAGGFIFRDGEAPALSVSTRKVSLQLTGKNVLEIVDAMCGQAEARWCLAPHAVIIVPRPLE